MVFKPLLDAGGSRPIIDEIRRQQGAQDWCSRETAQPHATGRDHRGGTPAPPSSTTTTILQLGRWAVAIEQHYGRPMDMEWARDGETGELFIVQARPETVQSDPGRRR